MDSELKKTLISVVCIGSGGFTGNRVADSYSKTAWSKMPYVILGSSLGATVAHFIKKGMELQVFGTPSAPAGMAIVQITWANGMTCVVENEITNGDLPKAVIDSVEQKAINKFGNQAMNQFPAQIQVVTGNDFYHGMIHLDEETVPILTMENASIQSGLAAKRKAENKWRKNSQYQDEALRWMRSRPPAKEGKNDFYMPIP